MKQGHTFFFFVSQIPLRDKLFFILNQLSETPDPDWPSPFPQYNFLRQAQGGPRELLTL